MRSDKVPLRINFLLRLNPFDPRPRVTDTGVRMSRHNKYTEERTEKSVDDNTNNTKSNTKSDT